MTEPTLTKVLHHLADVPVPDGLADRALAGARTRRRRRAALTAAGALATAGALAIPFLLDPGAADRPASGIPGLAAASSAADRSAAGACRFLPDGPLVEVKQVPPADWPEFVRITVSKLPPRPDYLMQSGYGVCASDSVPDAAPGNQRRFTASAYAVINLGATRQHGHLTVNLQTSAGPDAVTTCQQLRDQPTAQPVEAGSTAPTVLFCEDGTADTPMVYGLQQTGSITVGARYADRRTVYLESHSAALGGVPDIGPDDLRRVVIDRALVQLLPVA